MKYFEKKKAKHNRLRARYSEYWKNFYSYIFKRRIEQTEKEYFYKISELSKSEADLIKKMSILDARKTEADKLIADLNADLSRMEHAAELIQSGLQIYLSVKGRIEKNEKRLRSL